MTTLQPKKKKKKRRSFTRYGAHIYTDAMGVAYVRTTATKQRMQKHRECMSVKAVQHNSN